MASSEAWFAEKDDIRRQAFARRRQQTDKDRLSRNICGVFASLPPCAAAETIMAYVGVRDEVRTRDFVSTALGERKRLVVPYCVGRELELFRLESLDELEAAPFGLWEPRLDLRIRPDKQIQPDELDLVIVPGVAFDRRGGRLGHGNGYYDRLLCRVRRETPLIGLAFECQMFPQVPMSHHDVFMDSVVTEAAVYPGLGRRRPTT